MTASDQSLDDMMADRAGGAGHEDAPRAHALARGHE
jgi:hypothetical protein